MAMRIIKPADLSLHPSAEAAALHLPAIAAELEPFEGDDRVDAVSRAIERMENGVMFLRKNASDYAKVMRDAGEEVRRAQERERARVPTTGYASFADREAALREADSRVALEVGTQSARTYAAERAVEAEKIARGVVSAMQEAKRSIDAELAVVDGPSAFRMNLSYDQLAKAGAIREEYKTELPSKVKAVYEGLLLGGDEEKIDLFTLAIVPLLDEVCRCSMKQAADRLNMRLPSNVRDGGRVGEERVIAAQLRSQIRADRIAQIPAATLAAKEAFDKLVPVFRRLFGWHASWLTRAEQEQRAYSLERDPLAVHDRWFERAMPGTR